MRLISFLVVIGLLCWFELFLGVAFINFGGLPIYVWTLIVLMIGWLISLLHIVYLRFTNLYTLRRDSLEIRTGLITLHSFLVTPYGFSDLEVHQSLSGRIFRYGKVIVHSQSERTTELLFIRSPFSVAERIRAVMSKPSVRVDEGYV